ncbi:hypothetical protein ARTHRO8AJ_130009 [Arthrobacter sp. 8AJ]|nr:hypothetical protein ARTHRO8AJ_130009 [Arthrobacter sp. 8AJ]
MQHEWDVKTQNSFGDKRQPAWLASEEWTTAAGWLGAARRLFILPNTAGPAVVPPVPLCNENKLLRRSASRG